MLLLVLVLAVLVLAALSFVPRLAVLLPVAVILLGVSVLLALPVLRR